MAAITGSDEPRKGRAFDAIMQGGKQEVGTKSANGTNRHAGLLSEVRVVPMSSEELVALLRNNNFAVIPVRIVSGGEVTPMQLSDGNANASRFRSVEWGDSSSNITETKQEGCCERVAKVIHNTFNFLAQKWKTKED